MLHILPVRTPQNIDLVRTVRCLIYFLSKTMIKLNFLSFTSYSSSHSFLFFQNQDMFGAGTDATIIVLEWTMAELLRNPEVMKKLQTEVRSKVSTNTTIKEEQLLDMKYLRAVIKEIMRLHPPGPLLIPRESMERTHVQGYEIPKQARVVINAWAIGRDGEHWEAPNEFRPERFLSSNVDFRGRDFQLIPFGSGRRICPGIQFAMSNY